MAETNATLQILVRVRDEAAGALSRISNDVSDLGGSFNFAFDKADALRSALAAIGAGSIIGAAIKAFGEAQVQMAQFEAVVKTLPPELQKYREAMLAAGDAAQRNFGFGNEEASLALVRLVQATRDVPFAMQAFQAAMDLSRFKNISLEQAVTQLITAFQGNARVLKQFGIEVDEHASKETILAAVMDRVRGQAEAYSETFVGQMAITKEALGDFMEALGEQYVPVITAVNERFLGFIDSMGGVNSVLEQMRPLLTFIALFLAGIFIVAVVAGTLALLALVGVGATVIAAIAAIAAVLTFFITVWQVGWENVKQIFIDAWSAVKNFFVSIWNSIIGIFDEKMNYIRNALSAVVNFYDFVKQKVSQPFQSAASAIGNAAGAVGNFLGLAEGGIVTRPTFALVGESGAEAVIPLNRFAGIGGGGVNIYLQGDFYTDTESAERYGNEIARVIKNQLNIGIRA